jgi:DNA-binding transcriptional LysR family regulator
MNRFDWQWWQNFNAIAEHGSLSRAALALQVSQPTLGRQLLAMEGQLGQSLFDRSTQGLQLTNFGQGLLEESRRMQASAERLQRLANGQAQSLSGSIRLSANEMLALYYLPRLLPAFMDLFPQVSVEVEVSNRASSLDKRDSDVAIRMFTPTQLDIVARHLLDIPLGFFASQDYLTRHGQPTDPAGLFAHRILGFDRDRQFEDGARALGLAIKNEQFALRSDFMPLHLELAKQHGGVVASHSRLALSHGLVELDVGIRLPALPIYLACHRDVQHNKKIRALMDFLAEQLPLVLS